MKCIWCGGKVKKNPYYRGKFSIEVKGETERFRCKKCGRFLDYGEVKNE